MWSSSADLPREKGQELYLQVLPKLRFVEKLVDRTAGLGYPADDPLRLEAERWPIALAGVGPGRVMDL